MIYLDNAATSFPKPAPIFNALTFCLKKCSGNPGRSSHQLSLRASEAIYETRENVANLLGGGEPCQVVFGYNATFCLNLAIKTFVKEKCHIITSDFEHNSVIRPLESLRQTLGVEYTAISSEGDVLENLKAALRTDTRGIIVSIASNVTGDALPLPILSKFAEQNSLFLIIDASQAIGHQKIDLKDCPCDVLCAPGHKALFGIQGCGFAWFKSKERGMSFIEGGSGSESKNPYMPILLPEAYEAGTPATPAIATLGSGIKYVNAVGLSEIEKKLSMLTDELYEKLIDLKCVKLYPRGIGILSFNIKNLPSLYVTRELDKYGICLRGGLHCAPSVHRKMGTLSQGAIRASFSYLNKSSDTDKLYSSVKKIIRDNL